MKRFHEQALVIGDKVCVRLANFQSAVRKELKAKTLKQIYCVFKQMPSSLEMCTSLHQILTRLPMKIHVDLQQV